MTSILTICLLALLAYKIQRSMDEVRQYREAEGASPRPCLLGRTQHWGNGVAIHVFWVAYMPVHQHQHYHSTMMLD